MIVSVEELKAHLRIQQDAEDKLLENLLMQAQAAANDFCRTDFDADAPEPVRLAVLLMAAKYKLPVCPHAGGVGLCEYVQHLSMIDYLCIAGTREGRVIEYVDHLHEHFIEPCVIRNAAYMPPTLPGFSIEMKPESLRDYAFKPA